MSRDFRVESKEVEVCGRKMWMCWRVSQISVLMRASFSFESLVLEEEEPCTACRTTPSMI